LRLIDHHDAGTEQMLRELLREALVVGHFAHAVA
jgi:hypothetical protein